VNTSLTREAFNVLMTLPHGVHCSSNRNSLDEVASDLFISSIVKASGPRVGVAGQLLNVRQINPLREQIGNDGHAERMR
jgi:hypothetical protein